MKCTMPGCDGESVLMWNVWYVCQSCFQELMEKEIERKQTELKNGSN